MERSAAVRGRPIPSTTSPLAPAEFSFGIPMMVMRSVDVVLRRTAPGMPPAGGLGDYRLAHRTVTPMLQLSKNPSSSSLAITVARAASTRPKTATT